MRRRPIAVVLLLTGASLAAQTPAPQGQQPVFRTGIELLTVDATVVDREGRQITDLKSNEFTVEVDGNPRPVISAEYVKLVDDTPIPVGARKAPQPVAAPDEPFFSTNTRTLTPGRLILLLVDSGNIRVGQGRHVMRSAVEFVDGLSPADRVAMVAIPQGALVDFTTNHERVREALLATVGQAQAFKGRFHISLSEAIATVEHSDAALRQQLMMRECGGMLLSVLDLARCEIEVEQEAGEMVNHQRQQTHNSLRGMREVLRSLAPLEGPKSVILISEGLVLEGLGSEVDDIGAIAADVRASLDVMLLDVPTVDVTESQRPTTPREDREKQVEGLETLAGLARGTLHRVITSGEHAFVRVMRSIAGYYLLGVEARPSDRDGRRHRIQVKSNRRGVTVLARRGFLAPTAPAATSPADAVGRALRAPLTLNDLRMRIATWTYKEPGGSRVRLLVTAEVERNADQPLQYTAGIALVDRNNKVVVNSVEPRTLSATEADPSVAVYRGSVLIDPGTYLLRFAAADSEGRIGSVERKLDAWQMNAVGLTVGDLLIAQAPDDAASPIGAAVEPRVSNGRLAAMMEVYSPALQSMVDIQARLEIVSNENARPLTTTPMRIAPGSSPEVGVLQGSVSTGVLPPGRYLARAIVVQGGKPQGHLVRPFQVVARTAREAETTASLPMAMPGELLAAMLANLASIDRKDLLEPGVLSAVLTAAERARPTAKTAFATARAGKLGAAALEALTAGDQAVAAFLRGVEFYAQGNTDRAMQQLQIAMQQAPSFGPARLYLGALLAQHNRPREAASLLQSVPADVAGPAPLARMTGVSWLRAGDASLAIASLEKAAGSGNVDAATTRTLALAYVVANRPTDAVPLLMRYLEAHPTDSEALLAGIYAIYSSHVPSARSGTLTSDRTRAQAWAKTYASNKGTQQALVDTWVAYLQQAK